MMFNKGDRVEYTGKYYDYNDPGKVGWQGEVTTVKDRSVNVTWDNGTNTSVYKDNVKLVNDRSEPPEAIIIVNGNKGPVSYDVPTNDLDAMKNAFDELGLDYIVYRRES